MTDLVEFLLARVGEDEQEAQAATVRVAAPNWLVAFDDGDGKTIVVDPDRLVAECEAKRRIIADANKAQWIGQQGHVSDYEQAELNTLRVVLVTLSQPYRDHPDFDPSWLLPDTPKERP